MRSGFHMTLDGQLGDVARAQVAFAEFAAREGVPSEVRRSLQVVLDDLLVNIITYGLASRADGEATVDGVLVPDGLVLTITDNGPPFDPLAQATPDTSLSVEARPIGGLGIHLVRRMMDEASYHRAGDRNVTVLTKRWTVGNSQGTTGAQ